MTASSANTLPFRSQIFSIASGKSFRRTVRPGVCLPGTFCARRQACMDWCAGAVGGFLFVGHVRSFPRAACFVSNNTSGVL